MMNNVYMNTLQKKINSTLDEIEKCKKDLSHDSLLYETQISQLELRLQQLNNVKEKMEGSYGREKIVTRLYGDNVSANSISIRKLSSFFDFIQGITDDIATALDKTSNKVTNKIKSKTDLKLTEIFEGSFGMVLEANFEPDMDRNDNLITQTTTMLFNVLNAGNDLEYLSTLSKTIGKNSINKYKTFLNSLISDNFNIECKLIKNYGEEIIWSPSTSKIKDILSTLNIIQESSEELIEITGQLTKIDILKNNFEIYTDDSEKISGKSTPEMLINLRTLLGEKSKFLLTKQTLFNPSSNAETINWLLTGTSD